MSSTLEVLRQRIKRMRTHKDLTLKEVANYLGIKEATAQRYESGEIKNIPYDNIVLMAKLFDCSPQYLMGWETQNSSSKKGVKIPVLGKVPAGVPVEAVEDIIDYEEITVEMAKEGEFFGLQIKGNSMEPRICEGDVVIVRKQDDAETGDLVVAMINGNEATCKRLMKYKDGIRLMPNNPAYEPMYYSNKEIEEKPVKIIGKVVENRQKY